MNLDEAKNQSITRFMKVRVFGMSDRSVFVAYQDGEGFLVFGVDDANDIELGDTLASPQWDDSEGLYFTVKNLTRNSESNIWIDNWSMTKERAFQRLSELNHPTKISYFDNA